MKKGFTLLEVLIAVTLSGVIFLAITSFLVSLSATTSRTKQIDTLEQSKNDIALELSNTIRWAKKIEITDTSPDMTMTITADDGSNLVYSYNSLTSQITKNSIAMTGDEVLVSHFAIKNLSDPLQTPLLQISFTMNHKVFPTVSEEARFVVSQRVSTIHTTTTL